MGRLSGASRDAFQKARDSTLLTDGMCFSSITLLQLQTQKCVVVDEVHIRPLSDKRPVSPAFCVSNKNLIVLTFGVILFLFPIYRPVRRSLFFQPAGFYPPP